MATGLVDPIATAQRCKRWLSGRRKEQRQRMQDSTYPLVTFDFQGKGIRGREHELCLTDMWKAAGADPSRRPNTWLVQEGAREFIGYLETAIHGCSSIRTAEGRYGGTWAHWQIGFAYAKYLSPAFHAWCNEVVRAHMNGASRVDPAVDARLTRLEDVVMLLAKASADHGAILSEIHRALADRTRADANDTGQIGAKKAEQHILSRIRSIATTLAMRGTKEWRRHHRRASNQLRDRLRLGVSGKWSTLPMRHLADATAILDELVHAAADEAKARSQVGLFVDRGPNGTN